LNKAPVGRYSDGTVFHCASIAASFQVDTCRLVQHSNAHIDREQLQSLVPEYFEGFRKKADCDFSDNQALNPTDSYKVSNVARNIWRTLFDGWRSPESNRELQISSISNPQGLHPGICRQNQSVDKFAPVANCREIVIGFLPAKQHD